MGRASSLETKLQTCGVLKEKFGAVFIDAGLEEVIVPAIWEQSTFEKVGPSNRAMMWNFQDKGGRDICLVPEITGMIQETWRNDWCKEASRDIFYVARCYRYERPQKGRYREFTQIGIECLGDSTQNPRSLLEDVMNSFDIELEYDFSAKRGLTYYDGDGYEVRAPSLGAQKQIAGGGKYDEGEGWAIGLDRLMLALVD